jgi:CBS domain containing-hemolysin-like protein
MIGEYLVPILIILVLILLNGMFVAAEFAIVTASGPRMKTLADQGSATAARILKILNSPELQNRFITTAQVGITVASLGLGMYGEHVLADWLLAPLHALHIGDEVLAHTIATVLSVSLLTYLHVVIGEMIPKSFALQAASQVVITLYWPLQIADRIFMPLAALLNRISNNIIRLLKLTSSPDDNRLYTAGDLEFAVEESLESGFLEISDQLFIENILDLDDRTVGQIMTPRNQMFAIPSSYDTEDMTRYICQSSKTRYPVYEGTPDNILGILHLKDLARWLSHSDHHHQSIHSILRPALYIPEGLPLNLLLTKFRQEQTHLAVVLDEFGGTSGIITLEDLIEEVVGEILDEFDQEALPIEILGENRYRIRGDVILGELEQHLPIDFDENIEANSIGGYVMTILGSIPQASDVVELSGATITVEKVQRRAVLSVILEITEQPRSL